MGNKKWALPLFSKSYIDWTLAKNHMTQNELKKILQELRKLPAETEWIEFKAAARNFNFNDIGKYFSALSNEANLKSKECGWLIFGVKDKTREISGTQYRPNRKYLDGLKKEIADKTTKRISFIEIYELKFPEGRVIMFQIPAAPQGIPVAWEGHYYGRDGESLSALNIQELEQIRNQAKRTDWSAYIVEEATINDLMPEAIIKARDEYKKKHSGLASEVDKWDDVTFLNKAKITIQGKITRAAIILLGKPESEHFISPSVARITWVLRSADNVEKDYEHFPPPFILNVDAVLGKIRNLKYRYLPNNTLFPVEITQYESYVIREALHNCIAHQDYELRSKIVIVECPDELTFTNAGSFIPGTVESVIEQGAPPIYYRNQFLTTAMVNLNMIDTIGGGIKKMFLLQSRRFFPLPSYKLDKTEEVSVKIIGKVIDENYTKLLMENTDLDIKTIISLDRVQKKEKLDRQEYKKLKKQGLVEGRYPSIFVSPRIAIITEDKTRYIRHRAFDKKYYKEMVIELIKKFDSANRKDIDDLLWSKLSDMLTEKQKKQRINNLLYEMAHKDKRIKNEGSDRQPKWVLTE
jgi:ATP-dependent DNA helicase RecG